MDPSPEEKGRQKAKSSNEGSPRSPSNPTASIDRSRSRGNEQLNSVKKSVGSFAHAMEESIHTLSKFESFKLNIVPPEWSKSRRQLHHMLTKGENFIGCVVLVNFVLIIMETDIAASEKTIPSWLEAINLSFVVFYTIEIALRLYVQRSLFLKFSMNLFDSAIVILAILGAVLTSSDEMANLSMMRTFRMVRVFRALRVIENFRELWSLVRDSVACARTLMWAFILFLLFLSMWSVFAVELLHKDTKELDCESCEIAFSSVMWANLTFFALVAFGEGWEDIVQPLIAKNPWSALIFLGVTFTMMFGLLNILIATMIENATVGRERDIEEMAAEKKIGKKKEKGELIQLCRKMDRDADGKVSLAEMEDAITTLPEFKALLKTMDVGRGELECIFNILDEDHSGDLSYSEFASQIYKMRNAELTPLVMMIKYYVQMIWANTKSSDDSTLTRPKTIRDFEKESISTAVVVNDSSRQCSTDEVHSQMLDPSTSSVMPSQKVHDATHQPDVLSTALKVHGSPHCSGDVLESSQCNTCSNSVHQDAQEVAAPQYSASGDKFAWKVAMPDNSKVAMQGSTPRYSARQRPSSARQFQKRVGGPVIAEEDITMPSDRTCSIQCPTPQYSASTEETAQEVRLSCNGKVSTQCPMPQCSASTDQTAQTITMPYHSTSCTTCPLCKMETYPKHANTGKVQPRDRKTCDERSSWRTSVAPADFNQPELADTQPQQSCLDID